LRPKPAQPHLSQHPLQYPLQSPAMRVGNCSAILDGPDFSCRLHDRAKLGTDAGWRPADPFSGGAVRNLVSRIRSKGACLFCCTGMHRIAQNALGESVVVFGAQSPSTAIHRKIGKSTRAIIKGWLCEGSRHRRGRTFNPSVNSRRVNAVDMSS
jgi:hypothetical protein